MRRHLSNIFRDERGATSIEYALLGVFVSVSIIVGASTVGASVSNTFQNVADVFATAPGNGNDDGSGSGNGANDDNGGGGNNGNDGNDGNDDDNGNNGNGKDKGKDKGKGKGKGKGRGKGK